MPKGAIHISAADVLRQGAVIFLVAAAVLTAVAYPILRAYDQSRIEVMMARESGYIDTATQQIKRDYFEVVADLGVAIHLPSLRHYVNQGAPARLDDVAVMFQGISEQHARYDPICLIDTAGREIIRIDRIDGKSVIVAAEERKRTPECDFFEKAAGLGADEIYVSALELISEGGNPLPANGPVIHFAKAISDDLGDSQGAVVFNYLAREMLDAFYGTVGRRDSPHVGMLLDRRGHRLGGDGRTDESGFVLDSDGRDFAGAFPQEWARIGGSGTGEFRSDKGLFLFSTVYPLAQEWAVDKLSPRAPHILVPVEQLTDYYAKIVLWIPEPSLRAASFLHQPLGEAMIAFIYALLAALSGGLAYTRLKRKQEKIDRKHTAEMERQAATDPLTAAWNRRHFSEVAAHELARSKRTFEPLALLMLDIDHFKRINDTYGHDAGDRVLQAFAATCIGMLREIDIFARIGGEEFVALLPEITLDRAEIVAERLRHAISVIRVHQPRGDPIAFTVSIGVTCLETQSEDLLALLDDADKALYEAKRSGRNRVCVHLDGDRAGPGPRHIDKNAER